MIIRSAAPRHYRALRIGGKLASVSGEAQSPRRRRRERTDAQTAELLDLCMTCGKRNCFAADRPPDLGQGLGTFVMASALECHERLA
jgi:hypothetical protein